MITNSTQALFQDIRNWAHARNLINGSTPTAQALKGVSEYGEMADAVLKNDIEKVVDGVGDVLVVLTIVCEQLNIDILDCVQAAYNEIKDRQGVMYNGAFIKSTDDRYSAILVELGLDK